MSDPSLEPVPQARRGARPNERIEVSGPPLHQKPDVEASHRLGPSGEVIPPGNDVRGSVVQGEASVPVEKRYRYIGETRQLSAPPQNGVAGYRFKINPGKIISSLTYDLKHLAAQGISSKKPNPKLQRIDANDEDIDDD